MKNIKTLRKEKRLSQQELAERLNVHQTAVSQWESGRTTPDIEIAYKMAEIFGVSIDVIMDKAEISEDGGYGASRRAVIEERLEGVKFALLSKSDDLTEEDMEDVLRFMDFLKEKNKNGKK